MLVGGYCRRILRHFSHFLVPIFWPSMAHSFYCVLSRAPGVGSVHRHWPIRFVHRVQLHPGFVDIHATLKDSVNTNNTRSHFGSRRGY